MIGSKKIAELAMELMSDKRCIEWYARFMTECVERTPTTETQQRFRDELAKLIDGLKK